MTKDSIRLDRDTVVPLGSVLAIGLMLITAWSKQVQRDAEEANRLSNLESRLKAVEMRGIPVPVGNRWTCFDQLTYVYELRQANPGLVVPLPRKQCEP